jgi:hypothetical protein
LCGAVLPCYQEVSFVSPSNKKTKQRKHASLTAKTESNIMKEIKNIPASLTAQSFIGEIVVAYGFCTKAQVEEALTTQKNEAAAITEADKAGGKRARFTGQILVDLGYATQEQIDFGMEVQNQLRAAK